MGQPRVGHQGSFHWRSRYRKVCCGIIFYGIGEDGEAFDGGTQDVVTVEQPLVLCRIIARCSSVVKI